ncbi:MAG: hypothetical protein IIX64_01365 [Bacteroidales bacterium]|nr:hypothetical protein [Bacteroidales bacterium]
MSVANQIREKIENFPTGYVFTLSDFGLDASYDLALAKLLSRMSSSGEIVRASKGKYYKPRQTVFGALKPSYDELVKDFLMKDGVIIGYISGVSAFSAMGLTTQISSNILIGCNKYRRPVNRAGYKLSFLLQENPITKDSIELLRILDAIKFIQKIPGTTPSEACSIIIELVRHLDEKQTQKLELFSLKYTSYVRAIVGAILEYLNRPMDAVRRSINGVTTYKIAIPESILPTKKNWNIYEPTRK